jgi:hypothetical protein
VSLQCQWPLIGPFKDSYKNLPERVLQGTERESDGGDNSTSTGIPMRAGRYIDKHTDRQTYRHSHRQPYRQTHRQKDIHADTLTDIQTFTQTSHRQKHRQTHAALRTNPKLFLPFYFPQKLLKKMRTYCKYSMHLPINSCRNNLKADQNFQRLKSKSTF